MRETDRIRQQMKHAFAGGAWHGPAVLEVLEGVDAKAAAARPLGGAHTIWELTLHLSATQQVLLRRIAGEQAGVKGDEFWPPAPAGLGATDAAWRDTLETLHRREADLQQAVAAFDEARLDEPLMPGGTSAYNNFHGHVQHNLWHAGQMALLKRMIQK